MNNWVKKVAMGMVLTAMAAALIVGVASDVTLQASELWPKGNAPIVE